MNRGTAANILCHVGNLCGSGNWPQTVSPAEFGAAVARALGTQCLRGDYPAIVAEFLSGLGALAVVAVRPALRVPEPSLN